MTLDSTAIRAHVSAAGADKRAGGIGGQEDRAVGRSRGGFGTTVRVRVSGLGRPT